MQHTHTSQRRGRAALTAAFAAALLFPQSLRAEDDKGLWTGIDFSKSIGKHVSIDAGVGMRTQDWLNEISRWDFSIGATYKPAKWFSVGADYVFLHSYYPGNSKQKVKEEVDEEDGTTEFKGYNLNTDHAYWRNKHRAVVDLTGKVTWGRVTFSLRERYQFTHYCAADYTRTQYKYRKALPDGTPAEAYTGTLYPYEGRNFRKLTVEEEARHKTTKNRHYLRTRLMVEWNIRHCAWTPYASCELINNATHYEDLHLDKTRVCAGAEWKISKRHRLDFAYVYEHGHDDDTDCNTHALSIGYKLKF